MSKTDYFIVGMITTFFVGFILWAFVACGSDAGKAEVVNSCRVHGQVQIGKKLLECEIIEDND